MLNLITKISPSVSNDEQCESNYVAFMGTKIFAYAMQISDRIKTVTKVGVSIL